MSENMPKQIPEQIRVWYERTTRLWRRGIIVAGVIAAITAVTLWAFATLPFLTRLQTFNGAMIIPVAAGIWMISFVFIFLVPNREVGFRSQEALDRMEVRLNEALDDHLAPALKVWRRVGETVEKEINGGLVKDIRGTIKDLREAATSIEASAKDGKDFTKEAQPVLEALRRISDRLEREIKSGLVDDARAAFKGIQDFAPPPKQTTPDEFDAAIRTLEPRTPVRKG